MLFLFVLAVVFVCSSVDAGDVAAVAAVVVLIYAAAAAAATH